MHVFDQTEYDVHVCNLVATRLLTNVQCRGPEIPEWTVVEVTDPRPLGTVPETSN